MYKDLKVATWVLRTVIGAYWIWSGFVHIIQPKMAAAILYAASINPHWHVGLIITGACIDIILGVMMLVEWWPVWVAFVQMTLIAIYTVVGSLAPLSLWVNPVQPASKNIVIIAATWVLVVLLEYFAKHKTSDSF